MSAALELLLLLLLVAAIFMACWALMDLHAKRLIEELDGAINVSRPRDDPLAALSARRDEPTGG